MLVWHGKLWLIDHGAALYFHHSPRDFVERAHEPFAPIKDHVLLSAATELDAADTWMASRLTPDVVAGVVALIPDAWLDDDPLAASKPVQREAYASYFARRLQAPRAFAQEAVRARSLHV